MPDDTEPCALEEWVAAKAAFGGLATVEGEGEVDWLLRLALARIAWHEANEGLAADVRANGPLTGPTHSAWIDDADRLVVRGRHQVFPYHGGTVA